MNLTNLITLVDQQVTTHLQSTSISFIVFLLSVGVHHWLSDYFNNRLTVYCKIFFRTTYSE